MMMLWWKAMERALNRGLGESYCATNHLEEGMRLHRSIKKRPASHSNQPSDYEVGEFGVP